MSSRHGRRNRQSVQNTGEIASSHSIMIIGSTSSYGTMTGLINIDLPWMTTSGFLMGSSIYVDDGGGHSGIIEETQDDRIIRLRKQLKDAEKKRSKTNKKYVVSSREQRVVDNL